METHEIISRKTLCGCFSLLRQSLTNWQAGNLYFLNSHALYQHLSTLPCGNDTIGGILTQMAEVNVPTLDGDTKLNIPAGTQPGEIFTLKGNKGITRLNGMGKGDEHVRVIVDIPKNISSEQKELLKEFDKTYTPPKNGGKEGFFDKFKKK